MKLTASLRILAYLSVWAKNNNRLLMEQLGLQDVELEGGGKVLDFWNIDEIKEAITQSAGLLYFMDGTEGEIQSPTEKGRQAEVYIRETLTKYGKILDINLEKDDFDIEKGLVRVNGKEVKIGKFVNKISAELKKRTIDFKDVVDKYVKRNMVRFINSGAEIREDTYNEELQNLNKTYGVLDHNHLQSIREGTGTPDSYVPEGKKYYNVTMQFKVVDGISSIYFMNVMRSMYDQILVGTDNKYYVLALGHDGRIGGQPVPLDEYFDKFEGGNKIVQLSPGSYIAIETMQDNLKTVLDKTSLAKAAKFRYRITADPGDVLRMSCGNDKLGNPITWGSCMSPGGAASGGPITDVLAGSAAMFFYKSDDEKFNTPIGRNILRPATDEWDPIIVVSPITYGNGALPQRILEEIKEKFPDIHSEISGPTIRPAMISNGIYDDKSHSHIEQSSDELEDARRSLVDVFGKAGLIKEDKFQDTKELAGKESVNAEDLIRRTEYFLTRGMYDSARDLFTGEKGDAARDAFEKLIIEATDVYYKDEVKESYDLSDMSYNTVFDNYSRQYSEQIGSYIFQTKELKDKLYKIIDDYAEEEEDEPKEKTYIEKKVDEFEVMRDALENNATVPNWDLIFDHDKSLPGRFDDRFRAKLHKAYPGIDMKAMYKPMSWVVEHYSAYVIEIMDNFLDDKEELEAFIKENRDAPVDTRQASKKIKGHVPDDLTLYHGTVIDYKESIEQGGLMGGKSPTWALNDYEDEYQDVIKKLVFFADLKGLDMAVFAMKLRIGRKLEKDPHSVTVDEIRKYGLLAVLEMGKETSKIHHYDENSEESHPPMVEPGDWYYMGNGIMPDELLTGDKLIEFLSQQNQLPVNKKAMKLTASLRLLGYQTIKAKNDSRLLLDKLGLDEDVLKHWPIDRLKEVIENSAGLLYFMDGTTGTIKGPPANVNVGKEEIYDTIKDCAAFFKEETPAVDFSNGLVFIGNRKIRLGKYLTQHIDRINKRIKEIEDTVKNSEAKQVEVPVLFLSDVTSKSRIKEFDNYGTFKLEEDVGSTKGVISVNSLPELDDIYQAINKPLYVTDIHDAAIGMLVWKGNKVTEIIYNMDRSSDYWVEDEKLVKRDLETALKNFSIVKEQNYNYKVTADPGEVLRMSCGRTWESCMSPGGVANDGPLTDVYAGHAVIYFYVQDDTEQKTPIGRNIIRAGVNGASPVIIVSPSTKGNGPQPEDIAMELRKQFPDIKVLVGGFQDVQYSIMKDVYDDSIRGEPSQTDKEVERSRSALLDVFERNNLVKPSTNVKFSDIRDVSKSSGETEQTKVLYNERVLEYQKELKSATKEEDGTKPPKFENVFKNEKVREEFYAHVVQDCSEHMNVSALAYRVAKMSYKQAYREYTILMIQALQRVRNYSMSEGTVKDLMQKDIDLELDAKPEKKAAISVKAEDLRDFIKNHMDEFLAKYISRYKYDELLQARYEDWFSNREEDRFYDQLALLKKEVNAGTNDWDNALYDIASFTNFSSMVFSRIPDGTDAKEYLLSNIPNDHKEMSAFIKKFPQECAEAAKEVITEQVGYVTDLVTGDAKYAAKKYEPTIEEWIKGDDGGAYVSYGAGDDESSLKGSIETFAIDFENTHIKNGKIKLYRGLKLNKRWLKDLESTQFYTNAPLGVYWTVDPGVAQRFSEGVDEDQVGIILEATVDENQVDWNKTLEQNMSPSFGEAFVGGGDAEREVRLIKGTPIVLDDIHFSQAVELPDEVLDRTFHA